MIASEVVVLEAQKSFELKSLAVEGTGDNQTARGSGLSTWHILAPRYCSSWTVGNPSQHQRNSA